MKHVLIRLFTLALLLGVLTGSTYAQSNQIGSAAGGGAGGLSASYFTVFGNVGPACGVGNYRYSLTDPSTPWGSDYGPVSTYYSLPAGRGQQSFNVAFNYFSANTATPNYQVFVDGEYCASCVATVNSHAIDFFGEIQDYITITHQAGDAWSEPNNGIREFGLRYRMGNTPVADIRFKVVMVGTVITDALGYYDAPALPLYILRDPPGGDSYSKLTQTNGACMGTSNSVSTSEEENAWFKARLGVAGSFGLGVEVEYEIFVEAGVALTASQSETSTFEYETCVETTSEFTTPTSGTPDDLFILSGVRYAYGVGKVIERTTCGEVVKDAYLASVPVQVNNSYTWTESYIRSTVIPDLEEEIITFTPGSIVRNKAEEQLSVWHQTLAMNDSIKATAPFVINRQINGGNSGFDYSITRSTSQTRAIDYKVSLEAGLSLEFGVKIGGSGVSGGGSLKMRTEYGSAQNASNVSTNTMGYHLEDGDVFDEYSIDVKADNVFGTYVFALDSANSRTSCRYDGGYQIDQPVLAVQSAGNTTMTVTEAPIGSTVTFPLVLCNNSDTSRTYFLKLNSISNGAGGIWEAFGNILGTNDQGIQLNFLGGQCITANLTLTQPNASVVDFDNVTFYLYSLCDEEYPPFIRSYVSLSAHYGVGNIGTYCAPVSVTGTAQGDYVDGVQMASINNTGTGGVTGPAYSNYTAQFSTPLSRNAQASVTVTSGSRTGGHYAAWIDFDRDATFEGSEKLGEFVNTLSGEAQSFSFTVPADAALGATRLRVRAVGVNVGEPLPVDPCFNYTLGETEDYGVVIDANTPLDCLGVGNGTALPGTACDDGNANTGNDTWNASCTCAGVLIDCAGVPGGSAVAGSPCDDGNSNTVGDVYTANCQCIGVLYDCLGVAGGSALPGTPCNDGNPDTGGDAYNFNCQCQGLPIDCAGVIGGTTVPGTPCDDGNPLSGGDQFNSNCQCSGTFAVDCAGVPDGPAQPGTPCDDNDPNTGNDVYNPSCLCSGMPYDCAGTPGGSALPGAPCDDGNPSSVEDAYTANCECVGILPLDCAGVPGGSAQPSTSCDDGNPATGDDVYNAFCQCIGQLIDCDGVVGGTALPGFPCDDEDPATGNDVLDANCDCSGLPLDCTGTPGGSNTIGTPCDDGNAATSNDAYTASCICAGLLSNDCEGVAGGTAQPGTPCDDDDATTGNDVYTTACDCAGQLIDCTGTIGGSALPGTVCDDGDPCTVNDVRDANCTCGGTALTIGSITGPVTVLGNTSNAYIVAPVANATSYSWALPNGWTTSDNGAFALVAEVGNTPGPVQLCVTATVGGCALTNCITVNVDFNTGLTPELTADNAWFTVQPNPSGGVFQLVPSRSDGLPINVTVHDGTGRVVKAPFVLSGSGMVVLDLGDVPPGSYYLVATRNGRQEVMKLMVQQ
jgi:hypothetical protein